jgi:hypothetical protein
VPGVEALLFYGVAYGIPLFVLYYGLSGVVNSELQTRYFLLHGVAARLAGCGFIVGGVLMFVWVWKILHYKY